MKRKLLSFVFVLLCFIVGNSQVVELIGVGVHGKTSETLTLTDLQSIEKVDAFVTTKGLWSTQPVVTEDVQFDNGDTPTSSWMQITGDEYLSASYDPSVGVYSRSFTSLSNSEINMTAQNGMEEYIHSFYLFVHRDEPSSAVKSFTDLTPAFMYKNGSEGAYMYNISINTASSSRDIKVKIPISELDDKDRNLVIDIFDRNQLYINERYFEETWNMENSLNIAEYTINDVPGEVDEIVVSIYSPFIGDPDVSTNGDSFFVGGAIIDVEQEQEPEGCTLTQGYWKTHSECKPGKGRGGPPRDPTWDEIPGGAAEETTFFLSGMDYCGVFDTEPSSSKYYILAHQYIAAQLNILNGASPYPSEYSEATTFLNMYTPSDVNGDIRLQAESVRLGGVLDDFNNGRIGPGHCDDQDEPEVSDSDKDKSAEKVVSVFPNPVRDTGSLAFKATETGNTTVDIYNLNGQKIGTLFNSKVNKDDEVKIQFDTKVLKNGLYFAIVKNGPVVYQRRIAVNH